MPDRYRYTVNNFPTRWVAELKSGDGYQASTTAFSRTFQGSGATPDEALGALRAAMEEIGWFVSDDFAPETSAAR